MKNAPRVMHTGVDIPDFFDSYAVSLRVASLAKMKAGHELLAQRAARSFCEEGLSRNEVHAELELIGWLSIAVTSHIACGDTADASPASSYKTSAAENPG